MHPSKQISVYKNSYDTDPYNTNIESVFLRIQSGKNGLSEKTKVLHNLALSNKAEYKKQKESILPAPTFAGTFPVGKRKKEHLIEHSSYVVVDIDDIEPSEVLSTLSKYAFVRFAFISPSGTGIKAIIPISPTPQDHKQHTFAYQAVSDAFFEMDVDIDTSGKDVTRLCYLSWTPYPINNPSATPFQWDIEAFRISEKRKAEIENEPVSYDSKFQNIDTRALEFINPDNISYNDWLCVMTACKGAGFSSNNIEKWSAQGQKHVEGDVLKRWDNLDVSTVSWGTVIYIASENGYCRNTTTHTRRPSYKRKSNWRR